MSCSCKLRCSNDDENPGSGLDSPLCDHGSANYNVCLTMHSTNRSINTTSQPFCLIDQVYMLRIIFTSRKQLSHLTPIQSTAVPHEKAQAISKILENQTIVHHLDVYNGEKSSMIICKVVNKKTDDCKIRFIFLSNFHC